MVDIEKDNEIQYENNNLVTKSNILIEGNYSLTITEQKIILYLVSKVGIDDQDFAIYELPIKDFFNLLGYSGQPKYTEIRKITKNLMGKVLELKDGSKIKQFSWLSYVEYDQYNGRVKLSFDPRLKPHLLQLKKEFTSYRLKNVMDLKSGYSIRMYEILKKWQKVKQIEIDLKKLRKMTGVYNKYKEYHNFKKRVLNPSKKEINDKTDINFHFKEIKKGRKVVSICFFISKQSTLKFANGARNEIKAVERKQATEEEIWTDSLYKQINSMFERHGYTLEKNVVRGWVFRTKKVWGNKNYIEINNLVNEAFKKDGVKNHIALITFIINKKVEYIEKGLDAKQVNIRTLTYSDSNRDKEVIPEWFNEESKQSNLSDQTESGQEVQEVQQLLDDFLKNNNND